MADDRPQAPVGIGPFHVHRGHAFEGFRIVEGTDRPLVVASCTCGAVLDLADAVFATCPDCAGNDADCARCGSTGRVVDHAALFWRPADGEESDPHLPEQVARRDRA